MTKEKRTSIDGDMMMADILLRIKALENVLIAKGVFTSEEYYHEMESITKVVAKTLLEKANVQGDLDQLVDELKKAQN